MPGTGHDPNGHVRWLQSLTPWPAEFGLARVHELLADLGEPQRRYPAIHVVGTNGKSSTTLLTAELLRAAGLHVGAYISPHVRGWPERIQIDGVHADLEAALARIRPHADGATQFAAKQGSRFDDHRHCRRVRAGWQKTSWRISTLGFLAVASG